MPENVFRSGKVVLTGRVEASLYNVFGPVTNDFFTGN
jgi:hypothetical protein